MNENYTIPAVAEPITELPDTPGLTAAELKRRFQAPADEVRLAHNALAECVEGITSATYPDTVTEDMLTDALADKINGKAEQSDLDAETAAREQTAEQVENLQTQVQTKCRCVVGTFTVDSSTENLSSIPIHLGFTPKAVLLIADRRYASQSKQVALAVTGQDLCAVTLTEDGFAISKFDGWAYCSPLNYIAFV